MIAFAQSSAQNGQNQRSSNAWQQGFLEILPVLQRHLTCAFCGLHPQAREEALQEGIVNCLRAFVRLYEQDRLALAFPSSLARYAILHVRAGRTACSRLNGYEPLSRYAQMRKRIVVESLHRGGSAWAGWLETIVDARRASIPDQVALRIDVPAWLAGLSRRTRQIAKDLAIGCTTGDVARKYRLSAGRVSQIRRELYRSWLVFQGAAVEASPM